MPSALWIFEASYSSFESVMPAHLPSDLYSSFKCDSEQKKTLQQVQASLQAAPPLRPHDPAHPVVLEVSVADGDALWNI